MSVTRPILRLLPGRLAWLDGDEEPPDELPHAAARTAIAAIDVNAPNIRTRERITVPPVRWLDENGGNPTTRDGLVPPDGHQLQFAGEPDDSHPQRRAARASARARGGGRRGGARGARRRPREALDQARLEAPGARSGGADDRPDHARGCRHTRQG